MIEAQAVGIVALSDLHQRWNDVRGKGTVAEVEVLLSAWTLGDTSPSTRRRTNDLVTRFARRVAAVGLQSLADVSEDDCETFLWTPTRRNQAPSMHTVHLRRTALRGLFRTLRQLEHAAPDPTRGLDLPAKPDRLVRPLTSGQVELVRTAALGRIRRPMRAASIVALAEATATTGELPAIQWSHVDLDAGSVALPGADPIDARCGQLTSWGIGVLRRWQHETPHPTEAPIVGPHSSGATAYAAQAAMSSALSRLINSAGVTGPRVRPSSIRLWGGAQALAVGGVESAARALGLDSLDATADALDHHWRTRA